MVRNFAELVCVFNRLFLRELWRWTRQPFAIALGTYVGTEWRFCIRSVIQKCQVCRTILLSYHSIFCSQQNQSQSCRESENNSWCDSRGLRDAVVSFCSCGQYRAKWGWNQAGLGQPANWFSIPEKFDPVQPPEELWQVRYPESKNLSHKCKHRFELVRQ